MKLVVADASAIVEYLLRTPKSVEIGPIVESPDVSLHVPALCDVEVCSALRRGVLRNLLTERRCAEAVQDYLDLPLTRLGHTLLLGRILALRSNFSAYDATYVALAERLGSALLSADTPLMRAARLHTRLDLLP